MTVKVELRLQSLLIDYKTLQKSDLDCMAWTYITKLRLGLKGHPKSAWPIHHIQGKYLIGKWLGYVEIYCRDPILFLVWGIIYKGEQQSQKVPKVRILNIFVYICLSGPSIRKVCSVRFFRPQKFKVFAFFTTKVCSVRFFITKV